MITNEETADKRAYDSELLRPKFARDESGADVFPAAVSDRLQRI